MNGAPMSSPAFTVVMPAYNAADTIADSIGSVLAQTESDFELIIVDDGSTDTTADQVSRFTHDPRICLISQSNTGLAGARNRGLGEARAHYVSFLDADDLLLPRYLATMAATLARSPGAAFADCDFWALEDATGRISSWPLGRLALPREPYELMRVVLRRNVLHYGATVRREVLREVGFFNPNLHACEDVELWLRILAHGHAAVRPQGALSVYRSRSGSLSTRAVLMTSSLCEVYRLVAEEYDVPDDIRALAQARLHAERRRLAALTSERRLAGASMRVRRRVGALRRVVARARPPAAIPEEVAAAFPQLARKGSSAPT
jgi:glycosyltransferase involved in cell wall biosynthesis